MSFFQQLTLQLALGQLAQGANVTSVGAGMSMQTRSHQRIAGLDGLNGDLHRGNSWAVQQIDAGKENGPGAESNPGRDGESDGARCQPVTAPGGAFSIPTRVSVVHIADA
jgi:hypothetical protein